MKIYKLQKHKFQFYVANHGNQIFYVPLKLIPMDYFVKRDGCF